MIYLLQPVTSTSMDDRYARNALIKIYYDLGMRSKDIRYILVTTHGIIISERHLKRVLKSLNLGRRVYDNLAEVVEFIQTELQASGQLHGYRMMHAKCQQRGINVRMDDVRLILQQLDPEGVALRRARRLRRRAYFARGPNFIWHLDGYDKLKPFGLCINGCICGFSRNIIWLNVYNTNNNPKVIGGYFLEVVKECGGCPCIIRADYGTENGHVRDFQTFLRRNGTDDMVERAYIDGASTANQRIESWWGQLRKQNANFWIELLHGLQETRDFSGDFLDKSLIQFCFMSLLQVSIMNNNFLSPAKSMLGRACTDGWSLLRRCINARRRTPPIIITVRYVARPRKS